MDKTTLITPAEFIGFGVCPECGHTLCLMEKETNWYDLNKDGYPIEIFATYGKTEAVCDKCGYSIEYVRDGMKFKPYIPHEIFIRQQAMNNTIITMVTKEAMDEFNKNPFGFLDDKIDITTF